MGSLILDPQTLRHNYLAQKWLLKFHPNKCKSVTVARGAADERTYHLYDEDHNEVILEKSTGEKDIGVIVDEKLNFRKHIQGQVAKANSIMGLIRRTYSFLDVDSFRCLFKALVRPHLEYAAAAWCPHNKAEIEDIENVQRRATRQLAETKELSYPERLKKIGLPTLKYRRLRGDMIETFKIVTNVYDSKVMKDLLTVTSDKRTRGNDKKLEKSGCRKDVRKYSFSQRVMNVWNSLPDNVVNANSVKCFKARLDRLWQNQEIMYNHKAELDLNNATGSVNVPNNEDIDVDKVAGPCQRP